MLGVDNLAVGYSHAHKACDQIAFNVSAGEIACLLGPNGSGKTALLRTCMGLMPPIRGDVTLGGVSLRRLDRAEIARRVALVPQHSVSAFGYSVLDMVLMGRSVHLRPLSRPSSSDHELAYQTLHELGIAPLAGRPVNRISGGQRQLVLLARALVQKAPLVLMDEQVAYLKVDMKGFDEDKVIKLLAEEA